MGCIFTSIKKSTWISNKCRVLFGIRLRVHFVWNGVDKIWPLFHLILSLIDKMHYHSVYLSANFFIGVLYKQYFVGG